MKTQTLGPPRLFLQHTFCDGIRSIADFFSNLNKIGKIGPSVVLERCGDFFILHFIEFCFRKMQKWSYAAFGFRVHQKNQQTQVFHISERFLWVSLQDFLDDLPEMGNLIQVGYFVKPLFHPAVDFFCRFFLAVFHSRVLNTTVIKLGLKRYSFCL